MATEKNITMKEFNGTDYDILYPKTKVIQIDDFDDSIAKIVPVGSIYWYASTTVPDGFLLCDGSNIGRTDYASLFAVIGTVFGTGDGSTTFSLPDLRAKFVRGAGINGSYNATFGQTQEATLINTYHQDSASASGLFNQGIYNSDYRHSSGSASFSTQAYPTASSVYLDAVRPYNIALTPIIKY